MSTYHSIKLRMVNASGGTVWRNIIGTTSSTKKLQVKHLDNGTLINLLRDFLAVQTEQPYIDNTGHLQLQVESYQRISVTLSPAYRVVGTDSWAEIDDEKLLVQLHSGDLTAMGSIMNAATGTAEGDSLAAAVTAFSSTLTDIVEIVEVDQSGTLTPIEDGSPNTSWVSSHISGTMDTLIAEPV